MLFALLVYITGGVIYWIWWAWAIIGYWKMEWVLPNKKYEEGFLMLKLDEKKIRKGKPIGLPYQGSKKKDK